MVRRTGRIIARVAKTLPKNAELADLLELLADLLELDGADAFRLAAYRKAATRIREAAVPVAELAIEGKATKLSGLGRKTEEKVLSALAKPKAKVERRALLGQVLPAVERAVAELREHPAAERVSEAGSVRRRCETVHDLDIIATATDPAALTTHFASLPWVAEVLAQGSSKTTVVSHDGLRFDLRVVPPESYGSLLQPFTGSAAHNVALREDAVRRKLSVSEYGVENTETGEVFHARSEEELYEFLGYEWIPPELRENRGELAAARSGGLPRLVELGDLRGDLHMHTDWSDGRATLEEMVDAARALGHAFIAICDHAKRLKDGRLEQQAEAIAALNESTKGMRVLSGVEVDIRADGTVDLDDESLAERDWVMASIHSGFDQPRERITKRLIAALENPHVDCIGHPTGRKLNRRDPYDIDFEAVLEGALETGTFLEINSQPDRLDLIDTHARAAAQAGVGVVVSTDAHRVHELTNLELGVAQARRGWLSADHVVNTRSWRDVQRMLRR